MYLEEVIENVMDDDDGKWDMHIRRSDLSLCDGRVIAPVHYMTGTFLNPHLEDRPLEEAGYPTKLIPTPWATTQMCQRLGIPTAYFKGCPNHLQEAQFNHWVQHPQNGHNKSHCNNNGNSKGNGASSGNGSAADKAEVWMLRAREDSLRGVLSSHYTRMDNWELLDCLQPLVDNNRFNVEEWELIDESFHLRLTIPDLTREILPGDPVRVGIHVANSEVGRRAVTIDALIYRLICTNGLIRTIEGKSLLRQRHLHVSVGRFYEALGQAVSQAATTALEFTERLMQSTRHPLEDVETTLDRLGKRWDLSEDFMTSVKKALEQEKSGQQETVYGLVNALTNAAQRLPADNRYDIEVLAGRLIENRFSDTNGHSHKGRRARDDLDSSVADMARKMFPGSEVVSS